MKQKHVGVLLFAWISTLFILFPHFVVAQNRSDVFLLVLNQVSLDDIHKLCGNARYPWFSKAAIGEMNMRTAAGMKDIHSYLTIGTGVRSAGSEWARQAYESGEQGGKNIYRQYTGNAGESKDSVVLPYYAVLHKINKDKNTGAVPGIVGNILDKEKIGRAVIGNSDMEDKRNRLAPLLTMNEKGVSPLGRVGDETLMEDPLFPGGMRTSDAFVRQQIRKWKAQGVNLVVVELGDLARLNCSREVLESARYGQLREESLARMADFIGWVVDNMDNDDKLLVLSPSLPAQIGKENKGMAPALLWEGRDGTGGAITSNTTRQPGIIANIDIAPSILSWLGLPVPRTMKGMPIRTDASVDNRTFWQTVERINYIYSSRPAILYPYVLAVVAALLLAAVLLTSIGRGSSIRRILSALLCLALPSILLVPFLLLVFSFFPLLMAPPLLLLLLTLAGGALAGILQRRGFATCFLSIGFLNWIPVLLDGMTGGALIERSYLGFDPVIGARYYGIGNEYMGVVLGSSLLSLSLLGEKWGKRRRKAFVSLCAFLFAFIIFYMAWPGWGSKAGGVFVFLAAFSCVFLLFTGIPVKGRYTLPAFFLALLAACGLFWMNDWIADPKQSHIGRAVHELLLGDWEEIGRMVHRKLAMNGRLLLSSAWSRLFIANLLVSGFLLSFHWNQVRPLLEEHLYFMKGIKGIAVGAAAALLVNDSGIIAAALAAPYGLLPLLYKLLCHQTKSPADRQ